MVAAGGNPRVQEWTSHPDAQAVGALRSSPRGAGLEADVKPASRADGMETARILDDLMRPEAYSHSVARVELIQTHASLIFFAGDRVYKVKKPVDLGFLDFTDVDRRRHFCEEEVRLNRRLAHGVYLGVVPITQAAGGRLEVDGQGALVDWAVEMARLPAHRMLAELLARGEIDNAQMNAIAALLAEFHANATTGDGVDEYGSPTAIRTNTLENFEQLRPFVGDDTADVLSPLQADYLYARAVGSLKSSEGLFARRVREGRIREGHGDLHAGNICLTDEQVVVYDCIEFCSRFRCGDVAADLAFLTMDLDYRGFPGFSRYLSHRYVELSGDTDLRRVEPFYKAYRALVRAKVAALTTAASTVEPMQRESARREAQRYAQLAASYELPPAMILMCGLPASGKSWAAKRLARPLRAAVLHSDERRKTLAASGSVAGTGYEEGRYSPVLKRATYAALQEASGASLRSGRSVVVDATFSKQEYRAPFLELARELGVPWLLVQVSAPEALVRSRMEERARDVHEASEADLAVYLRARAAFEEPHELDAQHRIHVESGSFEPERLGSLVIDALIRDHERKHP